MIVRRHVGLSAALALLFAPVAVEAQSCSALVQERADLQGRMANLIATYPGTHIVIGMCAASASDAYDRTHDESQAESTFGGCAVIGCALVGFQNCADIASQWFSMALEASEISDKLKGCQ